MGLGSVDIYKDAGVSSVSVLNYNSILWIDKKYEGTDPEGAVTYDSYIVDESVSVTFSITCKEGYQLEYAAKGYYGQYRTYYYSSPLSITDSGYGLHIVTSRTKHSLTLSAGDYIESVSGEGAYSEESSVTVSATLSTMEGYNTYFSGWYDSSETLVSTDQSYTFTMPTSDYSLTAKGYAKKISTVSASKGDYIASVTGDGSYQEGDSVTVMATLSSTSGYNVYFKGWYDSAGTLLSTSLSYTFPMPAYAVSLTAVGTAEKVKYALNVAHDSGVSKVTVSYTSGYYDGTYDEWERYYVDYGDTVTLTMVLNTGQANNGWTDASGTRVAYGDTLTISNFSGGSYIACSQAGYFELALTAGAYISKVTGDGIYQYGTSVTAEATLSTVEGYEVSFSGWYDEDNQLVSKSESYTFPMPGEYYKLKAVGKAVKEGSGLMHIWDGTQWISAQPYIYNGSAWQQYVPYIYDGSEWKQGS